MQYQNAHPTGGYQQQRQQAAPSVRSAKEFNEQDVRDLHRTVAFLVQQLTPNQTPRGDVCGVITHALITFIKSWAESVDVRVGSPRTPLKAEDFLNALCDPQTGRDNIYFQRGLQALQNYRTMCILQEYIGDEEFDPLADKQDDEDEAEDQEPQTGGSSAQIPPVSSGSPSPVPSSTETTLGPSMNVSQNS
eukprot:Trichotokara_eunicae@DN5746_c0_g2_i3.p1